MALEEERLAGRSVVVFEGGLYISSGVPFDAVPLFPWPELARHLTESPSEIIGIDFGPGNHRQFIPARVADGSISLLGPGDPLMDHQASILALVDDRCEAFWAEWEPWMELCYYACAAAYHLGTAALDAARARERLMAVCPMPPEKASAAGEWMVASGVGGEAAFYSVAACLSAARTGLDKVLPFVRAWLPRPLQTLTRMRKYVSRTARDNRLQTPAPVWEALTAAWNQWGRPLVDYRDLHMHFRPLPMPASQWGAYVRRDQTGGCRVALPMVRNPHCRALRAAQIGFPDQMLEALVYCRDVLFCLHDLALTMLHWCRENQRGAQTHHTDDCSD